MIVDIKKKYRTRSGLPVRILSIVDSPKVELPVITYCEENDVVLRYKLDGSYRNKPNQLEDLVEVSPYEDFKVDDPVLAYVEGNTGLRRYFAGVTPSGLPETFRDGADSWSNNGSSTITWDRCVKVDK